MDKSAIFSGYETADCRSYEFDYHADYTQFLEEARQNADRVTPDTADLDETRKKQLDWEKKNRKSWKNSLFSWFKNDKKNKSIKQPTTTTTTTIVSKSGRGHASGPVMATAGSITYGRAQRATSGPLIGFFSSTRRLEDCEVPYMCLGQLNYPQKLQSYGPVYLVT